MVIPTCNRPQSLARCLKSLTVLDYPREQFEVVIVDDGGKGPLDALVEDYSHEMSLRHIRQENCGPASARNAGVRTARGRFIAFTDDDCAPAPDWLSSLQERFTQHPDCAIAGRAENGLPQNVFSSASQLLIDYLCAAVRALEQKGLKTRTRREAWGTVAEFYDPDGNRCSLQDEGTFG